MDWGLLYRDRMPVLERVRQEIHELLDDCFSNVPRIDKISTRVKSVKRFAEKADKVIHFRRT